MPSLPLQVQPPAAVQGKGVTSYFTNKIEQAEHLINSKTQNLRRLEAQRNALNARVRLLREELQLLQEPGSYVGEVVKVMGKKKVLVKVQPEGKYGAPSALLTLRTGLGRLTGFWPPCSRRLCAQH
jgi:26S proteasome regulatory subunit T6